MATRARISSDDDIPNSISYSRLLFEVSRINGEGRTAAGSDPALTRALSKDRSSITRQLKTLCAAGYLESEQQDKYNRIGYTINVKKILSVFLDEYEARLSSDYEDWAREEIELTQDAAERDNRTREFSRGREKLRAIIARLSDSEPGLTLGQIIREYLANYTHYPRSGFTISEAIASLIQYQHLDSYAQIYVELLAQAHEEKGLDDEGQMLTGFLTLVLNPIPRRPVNILSTSRSPTREYITSLGYDANELDQEIASYLQRTREEQEEARKELIGQHDRAE